MKRSLFVILFSFIILSSNSGYSKLIECDGTSNNFSYLSSIYSDLNGLTEKEARQDPRISRMPNWSNEPVDSYYKVSLTPVEEKAYNIDDVVDRLYAKLEESIDNINNPKTEEQRKAADGFKVTHTGDKEKGKIKYGKNFPFVGEQGLTINYTIDKDSKEMVLFLTKTKHAKWKENVEPKVYEFLGELLADI